MLKEIVLVGNGSNLMDKKLGSLIDSHEKVLRFNAYKIKGFEEHCGTRTDIWVRHPYVTEQRWDAEERYIKVSKGRPLPPGKWKKWNDQMLGDAGQVYIEQVLQVSPDMSWCWSTGVHTLAHFAMLHECVSFCGFGVSEHKTTNLHYYPGEVTHELHRFDLEREFIDFLISIGRAQEL